MNNAMESMEAATILTFIEDPGHAWLKVPRSHLNKLGISGDITPYSYMSGNTIYLEEDLDWSTYMNARKEQGWSPVEYRREYHERWVGRDRYPGYQEK